MDDHCNVCDCDVPCANWDQHCAGRRHQENLEFLSMKHCDVCDCDVAYANWDQHCAGRRHRDNLDDDCDQSSSECTLLHVSCIRYGQDSIANYFKDGTTIEKGIAKVKAGKRYTVKVFDQGDGTYVAMNNRTLFCLRRAGMDQIPVKIVPCYSYKRSFDEVNVRGGYGGRS